MIGMVEPDNPVFEITVSESKRRNNVLKMSMQNNPLKPFRCFSQLSRFT
jgi:hypothetical protein